MLTVISPAKTLDYDSELPQTTASEPLFLERSEALVEHMRSYSTAEIASLMAVSDKIAELNVHRFAEWQRPFTTDNARPAVYAFKGDVYEGLQVRDLQASEIGFMQQHLRILSGLYGCLRPLDLMQPYRLEMGRKVGIEGESSLYGVWRERVTALLDRDLDNSGSRVLINLASNEYFKVINRKTLDATVITPEFRDLKNGQYKMISFYAKRARGLMSRYMIRNAITDAEALKDFNLEGYRYDAALTKGNTWVFTRDPQQR